MLLISTNMTKTTPAANSAIRPLTEYEDPFGDDTRFMLFEHELAIFYSKDTVVV